MNKIFIFILLVMYFISFFSSGLAVYGSLDNSAVIGMIEKDNSSNNVENLTHLKVQDGLPGVSIFSHVEKNESFLSFRYYLTNNGDQDIFSIYIDNDALNLISGFSMIYPKDGWVFDVTLVSIELESLTLLNFHIPISNPDPGLAIHPGETVKFGYDYLFDPINAEFIIGTGIWIINNLTVSEEGYSNPNLGQLENSTVSNGDIESLNSGKSEVYTLRKNNPSCVLPDSGQSIDYFDNETSYIGAGSMNITKDIKTHNVDQHWSDAGKNGCLPTSMAYSLSWWGEKGIAPPGNSSNPLNITNDVELIDLINKLVKATNTTEANGVKAEDFAKRIQDWFKSNNLSLLLKYFDFRTFINASAPSVAGLIKEFLTDREDVVMAVSGRNWNHALTVKAINTTKGEYGYQVVLVDPDNGKEIKTWVSDVYFNGTHWTPQKSGNETYMRVWYGGRWLTVGYMFSVSPTNPKANVEGNTSESSNKNKINTNFKISRVNNWIPGKFRYSYNVTPVYGSGSLINTFALFTGVKNVSLLSNFNYPNGWLVTLKRDQQNNIIIYSHNNALLGSNIQEIGLQGTQFSFDFQGDSSEYGNWLVGHSGLTIIDETIEDGSYDNQDRLVLSPSEAIHSQTTQLTTTKSSTSDNTSISFVSFEFSYLVFGFVLAVVFKKKIQI